MSAIPQVVVTPTTSFTQNAITRYKQGYSAARTIVGFGIFIRIIFCILGGLDCIAGLTLSAGSASANPNMTALAGSGIAIGLLVVVGGVVLAIFGWIIGTFVMAQGQLVKASLDCAVHGSPFLDIHDKASVMSL